MTEETIDSLRVVLRPEDWDPQLEDEDYLTQEDHND